MTVRDHLKGVYEQLYRERNAHFIGYNVGKGSRMYGTLTGIPSEGYTEMPCAENLMVGVAIGMALSGRHFLPVLCFERHEFALFGLGMLAVMADKLHRVTGTRVPMVARCILGGDYPLYPGEQHCVDYSAEILGTCRYASSLWAPFTTVRKIEQGLRESPSGIVIIMEARFQYEKESQINENEKDMQEGDQR